MTRRSFFGAALAAVAGLFIGKGITDIKLRRVERFDGRRWVQVRMASLKAGDCFTVEDEGPVILWEAVKDGWSLSSGEGSVEARSLYRLDLDGQVWINIEEETIQGYATPAPRLI